MAGRTSIDPKLKERVVKEILSGEITAAEACKTHHVHPYQVDAWIGQALLKERERGAGHAIRRASSKPDALDSATLARILTNGGDDVLREVGRWYIETQVLGQPGGKSPLEKD